MTENQDDPSSGGAVVYSAEGGTTSDSGIWWLIVFGVLGAITMSILGFIIPERVGSGWIYVAVLVGFIALGWWAAGRGMVVIALFEDGDELRAVIKGPTVNISELLAPGYEHWHNAEKIPLGQGGGVMMHMSVVVKTTGGRLLGFRQMGGSTSEGWPEGEQKLGDGEDVFMCLDIFGLERALSGRSD